MRQVNGGVYHVMNITNSKEKFTKEFYLRQVENGELDRGNTKLNNVFNRLRNTKEYWKKPMCDLNAMIKEYGPATWFLTFSPGDWQDAELIQLLRDVNRTYTLQLTNFS